KCGELSCPICRPPCCLPDDFEQLYCLPDPVPGDDIYYKLFEKLYGMRTTEIHRPSFKTKTNYSTMKTKHIMSFCPSAACAKNVHITVKYVECNKLRLLFSAKKLSEQDFILLHGFLDTIFYTCGMLFYEQPDLYDDLESKNIDSDKEAEDQENTNKEDENESELEIFVNNLLSCTSKIEKLYYLAKIYSDICIKCGCLEVSKLNKDKYSYCTNCGGSSKSKKSFK
ncbi:11709_t:CDS:2, partial [Gigaspora margarita]